MSQVNVGFGLLPALLGGQADAILGGFRNVEGVDLEQRGKSPVVTPVSKLGVPRYDELVLVARGSELEQNAEKLRLFISALAKGTADAVADPAAATQAVLRAGEGLGREQTRAEIDATLPLLARTPGEPFGKMSPEQWELFDRYNEINAESLEDEWDFVIVHDPQPVGMKGGAQAHGKHWIWRCHIDLSTPNPDTLELILPHISEYDASFWHQPEYVPEQAG